MRLARVQACERLAATARQTVLGIRENLRHATLESRDPLRHHNAELSQQLTQLIALYPMQLRRSLPKQDQRS
jgi:hypothetical protein